MKKYFFVICLIIAIITFFPKKNISDYSFNTQTYKPSHCFTFIVQHQERDRYFTQKIYSILDQEYENFHILLFIDKSKHTLLNNIKIYAKKANKGRLLEIIESNQNLPIGFLIKQEIDKINKKNILVFLNDQCMLSNTSTLNILDKIYKKSQYPLLAYSNHIKFPSLQTNTKEVSYQSSCFKTMQANYIQDNKNNNLEYQTTIESFINLITKKASENTYYIKHPLYLKTL